ncbi:hypothetical protein L3X38_009138 [Prunus dulcis]|uniref:Uncharacterized protein n=1 Tax=Prunus dulcis TaxID=3755 RepID=A0AAD4ZXT3_PRUDU|nr:hypothetical protein L3X38_009138 [Prunus dulcis]
MGNIVHNTDHLNVLYDLSLYNLMGCEKRSETATAYIPGQFTYFLVTGTLSLLGEGFSTEFMKHTKSTKPDWGFDHQEAGLSASLITLEANAINSPIYTTDTTVQVVYVAGGSGQIQIVRLNGKLALDTQVKALVICLWFQASSWLVKLAGENGLECFSVITSSQPVLEDLAGKTSALVVALSPEMLQISLNITQDLLRSRIRKI